MTTGKVVEYLDQSGASPFARWFGRLDPVAAAKVTTALYRMQQGNFSSVKPVGQAVSEYRIDFGPGYRIYFGRQGGLIILLGGGVKKGQQTDIREAQRCWRDYKSRMQGRHHADHP